MNKNGVIIHDVSKLSNVMDFVSDKYCGIHRFYDAPLINIDSREVSDIQNEVMFQTSPENPEICNQFISNSDLAKRYIAMCQSFGISIRILFVESDYTYEIWKEDKPNCKMLGYEVTEMPLGIMTLYDLYSDARFVRYKEALNENGLFANESAALEFMNEYKIQLSKGLVGDGLVDLYLCRVYYVENEYFNKA